jgi:uncharacterized protein (UPF0335 family)
MKSKNNAELRELCKNNHYADWLNLPRLLDDIERLEKEKIELEAQIKKQDPESDK